MPKVRASSRLLVVVGDPIKHSLSPAMHNAAITALGLDAVYVALRAEATALPHLIRGLEAVGVAGNVTLPHKTAVAQLLIRLTPVAKDLGAVNTFWPEGGRLVGDNTDVPGLLDALDPLDPHGPWLVAGTGGSARAVAAAAREKAVTLLIQSRDPARAAAFAAWARELGTDALVDDGRPVGTAINATPLGLRPDDPLPFSDERLDGCRAALDLVYRPGGTPWVRRLKARGIRAADGRSMLVAQGAYAFERFFPGCRAPREIMAAAVERALKETG
ncbi:MAG: shikimate dehydrogenase (NADP(+)) [Gemmatimonadales bacterium]|nr:MAG: shikimate dehydrogenase (NADP(+)) [Gemmatimonadales bacterium]